MANEEIPMNINTDEDSMYWADPRRPGDDVAESILEKISYERQRREPLLRRWHRNYCFYHNYYYNEYDAADINDSNIFFIGEQGETVAFSVNQFHNLIEHMFNIITASRPAYSCTATNSDYDSRNQCRVADDLLDYVLYHYNLEDKYKRCVKYAQLFDAGYIKAWWDTTKGDIVVPADPNDPNSIDIRSGEPSFEVLHPKDVFWDDSVGYFYDNQWVCLRWYRNKWDMVASFPDKEEDIKNSNRDISVNDSPTKDTKDDNIVVYEFFHKPTPSVPAGRYMLMTVDGVVLLDHELELDFIPVFQMTSGDDLMHQNGYSAVNDLAAIQQILNAQYSNIASNHDNLGVPIILVPAESNITIEQLEGNYNVVKYDGEKAPGRLDLLQNSQQMFEFIGLLEKTMETLSGVNSVTRGNLPSANTPGVSIALLQQQTLDFMSHLQQSYTRLVEQLGLGILKLYKANCNSQIMIDIVGKNRSTQVQSFTGSDVKDVNRVKVSFGNPMARTLNGRLMLAEYVAKIPNLTLSFENILTILETGDLESLIDSEVKSTEIAMKENEVLAQGTIPRVVITDDHRLHILRHTALLDDPKYREENNPIFDAVTEHINNHIIMLNDPNVQQLHALLGHATGIPQGQPGAPGQRPMPAGLQTPEPLRDLGGGRNGINVQNPQAPNVPAKTGNPNMPPVIPPQGQRPPV